MIIDKFWKLLLLLLLIIILITTTTTTTGKCCSLSSFGRAKLLLFSLLHLRVCLLGRDLKASIARNQMGFKRSGTHNLQGKKPATLRETTEGLRAVQCPAPPPPPPKIYPSVLTWLHMLTSPHFCSTQLTLKFNINAARFCSSTHIHTQYPNHRRVTILFLPFHLWPLWIPDT